MAPCLGRRLCPSAADLEEFWCRTPEHAANGVKAGARRAYDPVRVPMQLARAAPMRATQGLLPLHLHGDDAPMATRNKKAKAGGEYAACAWAGRGRALQLALRVARSGIQHVNQERSRGDRPDGGSVAAAADCRSARACAAAML
jgi:hypothetical protein